MPLDRRQIAMLREMGVPFWPAPWRGSDPASHRARAPQPDAAAEGVTPHLPDVPGGPVASVAAVTSAASAAQIAQATHVMRGSGRAGSSWAPQALPSVGQSEAASTGGASGSESPSVATSVAGMDWPALQEAVRQCQACALCSSRTHTVFGVGHPRAHWMVVGEAPGEQEDLRGEPFVGPAGVLLDRMLAALGLSRGPAPGADPVDAADAADREADPSQRVYITNTLKCRPPRNRNPEPQEMQRCEPFLQRQIALVQPRLILAMGRFAVQALLRTDEAIGRLRGRVHRYQGVPLVVTYHPAYLLRNPADKAKAWDDLCLAAQALETSDPPR
jgi:uracil-DNA glycosylase